MKKLILGVGLFSVMFTANAQEEIKDDFKRWQIRARGVAVIPSEAGTPDIIGGDVAISNAFIPELDITYYFTENFAAELILGTAKHDVSTRGSDISAIGGPTSADIDLGSVYLLPPTLMAQYHVTIADVFKPYVGAGVNYTIFYGVDEGPVVKDVSYDAAFGYGFQIGFDLELWDNFYLNLDMKKLYLSTDVSVDGSNLAPGLTIPAKVDIDPLLLGFGVGMRF